MKKLSCLEGKKSVALIAHIDPDTDALASCVVLKNFLHKTFKIKRVEIFAEFSKLDDNLVEVIDKEKINPNESKFDDNNEHKHFKFDVAIIMDCPNLERVGKFASIFKNAKFKMNIDHHDTNKIRADKKFVKIVSSTCEVIYELFKQYHYEMNSSDKGKIYAGIITDTNNLTVGAITPHTYKIISEILPYIDAKKIYKHFFCNNSLRNMQLLSKAVENIVTFSHGKIIISHITKEQAKMFKASDDDYIGISNRLAGIMGCMLMCFTHPKKDKYYVSLRASEGFDVASLAVKNGGGGHKGAAAFLSTEDLSIIEQNILQEFTKIIAKTKHKKVKIF